MNKLDHIQQLDQMVTACVSPFHCILESSSQLKAAGFEELALDQPWQLCSGKSYFVNAFHSTLIAFQVGTSLNSNPDLRIIAAHTDWPCLKIKPSPEVTTSRYGKLNIEVYGGPILNTWLDRPLSMAGKVCLKNKSPFSPNTSFVDFQRPLITIPNLAIHMNRSVNEGTALDAQVDMLPLLTIINDTLEKDNYFLNLLAQEIHTDPELILDYEIYVYNTDSGTTLGLGEEFYSAPRLDNITSVHAALNAIIQSDRIDGINMIALYDNEEIGSHTKQGAASALTERIIEKMYLSLGYSRDTFLNALFHGFLLSMDVAHALHPNHTEKCDIKNQILLNDGIAIKMAASQSYATDATAVSIIEQICQQSNIPYKKFSNRSNIRGGNTLGSIASSFLTMKTVDVGVPLLAMHSSRELMGVQDQSALLQLATEFFLV